jgi:uncharacterized protein (DUF58 family)
VCGWALGYIELDVFGAGGVIALAAGELWLLRRSSLEVTRVIEPMRVQRGGIALGLVSVTNRGRRPSPAISARDVVGADSISVALPRLAAGGRRTTTYRLPTAHRGVVRVGPLTILREDPFGTLRRAQTFGQTEMLWIHPAVHPLVALVAGRSRHVDGPASDSAPQGSITFHALREYVPGDDLRRIHWRSTARLGAMMVVTHIDTAEPQTTVLLDTRRSSYDDASFEEAMDVAASVIAASTLRGFPVHLHTTCQITVGRDRAARETSAFLDRLALLTPSSEGSLLEAAKVLSRLPRADALVLITGGEQDEGMRGVALLRRHFSVTVLVSIGSDVPTADTPPPPGVAVIRAATAADFAAIWNRRLHRMRVG